MLRVESGGNPKLRYWISWSSFTRMEEAVIEERIMSEMSGASGDWKEGGVKC